MLSELFRRLRPIPAFDAPAPETRLSVIGDVHGRAELLTKALDRTIGQVILVGDYIDRGEHSADVLRLLMERPDLVCLMGNHEEMLLRTLDDPQRNGSRWLRYGGLQTMASFGVSGVAETTSGPALTDARDRLAERMGPDMIAWLRALPSVWQSGNVVVTHAGANPAHPIKDQDSKALRWGHPDFRRTARKDGLWVVHGHYVTEHPVMEKGRINVDTGAYTTGKLTVAHFEDTNVSFEAVS
ncbi:MAG: serine/threonine protein phosphatase [Rhodobacterales bacterium]|nr:MAG: serine/threonine protein phosphatase [Rhodobacterales bacterium]